VQTPPETEDSSRLILTKTAESITFYRMQQTTPHHSETCQVQLRGTILALHLLQNLSKGLPVF